MAKKSRYQLLKNKWLRRHQKTKVKLLKKHQEALTWLSQNLPSRQKLASAAIGALMLTATFPASSQVLSQTTQNRQEIQDVEKMHSKEELAARLSTELPPEVKPLTEEEEVIIGKTLSGTFGIEVTASLDGKRLNRSYGQIGAEQHLFRYPGDNINTHFDNTNDRSIFASSGLAPGRGAWGYFTSSKASLTQKDIEREKWYIAVQTFLVPDYNQRVAHYRDFFKYRKMLVVNPKTGLAVVTDIADAGPAAFTGKHLGGSPEVMYALGLDRGPRKGPVLYFFINDPDDKIPLGSISPPEQI